MNPEQEQEQQTSTTQDSPEDSLPKTEQEGDLVEVNFDELTNHFDSDDDSDAPNPLDASAEEPPEPPAEEPSGEEPPKEVKAAAPEEVPPQVVEEQKQTPEATQPAKEVAPEAPPQKPQKSLDDYRAEMLPDLEKFYVLPEDIAAELKGADALELNEALVKVLPKLAARMHFEMQSSILQTVGSQMMPAVQQAISYSKNAERLESDFYGRWPKLKGQDERVIAQTIQAYVGVNPKASESEIIERAGAMAMFHLGLDPLADSRKQEATPPPAPPAPKPHTPASPSGSGSPIFSPKKSDNFFASLAEDFMKEDFG